MTTLSMGCASITDLRSIPESNKAEKEIFVELVPQTWAEDTTDLDKVSISWNDLKDPDVHRLIDLAIKNNLSLKNSYLALAKATNSFKLVKQQRRTQYGADANASAIKVEDIDTQESYTFTSFARYEVDLWNTIKSRVKNNALSIENLEEDLETLKISLASTVASLYFDLKVQDQVLKLRKEQLGIVKRQRDLQSIRLQAGAITRLDVDQLDVEIQSQESNIETLISSRLRTEQNLAILVGQPPQSFKVKVSELEMFAIPRLNPEAPSTLITRRPDIKRAERAIEQANLSLHEARTAYLPSLSLAVTGNKSSDDLSDFLSFSDITHTLISSLQQTILDDGDRKIQKQNAEISVEQELNNYRLAILESLSEVESALINQNENIRQISILNAQIEAQKRAAQITKIRYETGSASAYDFIREQQIILSIKEREFLNWQKGINTSISLLRSLNINPETRRKVLS